LRPVWKWRGSTATTQRRQRCHQQQRGKYAGTPRPDLIVLDLNLPKYDGPEILDAMRMNDAFDRVPVAVLTSSASPHDRSKTEVFHTARYITTLHQYPPDLDEYLKLGLTLKELLAGSESLGRSSSA
jgi:CheY-like chemotaxis protein